MLNIDIVTPESLVFSEAAHMAIVPGTEGDFGVLEFHAPLLAMVRPGVVTIEQADGKQEQIFVAGGLAEVVTDAKGSRCTVLAEEAEPLHQGLRAKAEERLRAAEKRLELAVSEQEKTGAEIELGRARALVSVL